MTPPTAKQARIISGAPCAACFTGNYPIPVQANRQDTAWLERIAPQL